MRSGSSMGVRFEGKFSKSTVREQTVHQGEWAFKPHHRRWTPNSPSWVQLDLFWGGFI